ncbi:MAG: S1C family serine protease [Phycisphaerae bacterium]
MRTTQEAFRAVAHQVRPSLVRIETLGGAQPVARILDDPEQEDVEAIKRRRAQNLFRDTPGSDFVIADGPTTGIVYSADGYIIASSFNFVREPLVIFVSFADGSRKDARLIARDQVRKIALLKIDAQDLTVPRWRSREDVQVGEWAVALGMGFGGEHPSVTVGIVSALNRMHGNAIQTDAKLSPANYGGPLCDIEGNVIGVCVPMAQRPGELAGVEFYDSGIGFVLPKQRIDEIVAVLKTGRSFYRGWLGISVNARAKGGALIRKVADPSPARTAGLRPGDRIQWAQGREVHHFGDLVQAIYMIPAGYDVYLQFQRSRRMLQGYYRFGDVSFARWDKTDLDFGVTVTLARNTELGALPEQERPELNPAPPGADSKNPKVP